MTTDNTSGPELERHLDAWLERHYDPLDDLTAIRSAMLALVAEDEIYWLAQGWWKVHDAIIDYGAR